MEHVKEFWQIRTDDYNPNCGEDCIVHEGSKDDVLAYWVDNGYARGEHRGGLYKVVYHHMGGEDVLNESD